MKAKMIVPVLVLLLASFTTTEAKNNIKLNPKEAKELLKRNKDLIIIDVRTPNEFNAGHLKWAINIDVNQHDATSKIDKLNRNAKYIVYCRTSNRSGMATQYMVQKGFKTVYQMVDGFSGWTANNFEYEK